MVKNEEEEETGPMAFTLVMKDDKRVICTMMCEDFPIRLREEMYVATIMPPYILPKKTLQTTFFYARWRNNKQKSSWYDFLENLKNSEKIAVCNYMQFDLFIAAPESQDKSEWSKLSVQFHNKQESKVDTTLKEAFKADLTLREAFKARQRKKSQKIKKNEENNKPKMSIPAMESAIMKTAPMQKGTFSSILSSKSSFNDDTNVVKNGGGQAFWPKFEKKPCKNEQEKQGNVVDSPHYTIPSLNSQSLPSDNPDSPPSVFIEKIEDLPKPKNPNAEADAIRASQKNPNFGISPQLNPTSIHTSLLRPPSSPRSNFTDNFSHPPNLPEHDIINNFCQPYSPSKPNIHGYFSQSASPAKLNFSAGQFDPPNPYHPQQFDPPKPVFSRDVPQQSEPARPNFSRDVPQQSEPARPNFSTDVLQQFEPVNPNFSTNALQQSATPKPNFSGSVSQPQPSPPEPDFPGTPFQQQFKPNPEPNFSVCVSQQSKPTPELNISGCYSEESKPPQETDSVRSQSSSFINSARVHPSYLETISEIHSQWVFGALAEFIDNSRDAGASRVDVCIRNVYFPRAGEKIPVLTIQDNGSGMTHSEISNMITLGARKKTPIGAESKNVMGMYGVGFKTGAMRLGEDALVLTQSTNSRSVALLSRSFNRGKEEIEIPLVTYERKWTYMDLDSSVNSKEQAEASLNAIREISPFNEYSIGEMFGSFGDGTGTKVLIFNLGTWGANYTLQWDEIDESSSTKKKKDIWIRSKRVLCRSGQLTNEVPMDYSLQAYLEVIFMIPNMKMFVQGSQVGRRHMVKSLQKPRIVREAILGKDVTLTIGVKGVEAKRGNCGIFLYWHGRLIESYKRVGGMLHSADMGRGVIGVVDVTDFMVGIDNKPLILNNKQGFKESQEYVSLEHWLGVKADEYWDECYDPIVVKHYLAKNVQIDPENDWVRCDKCQQWRMLPLGFPLDTLKEPWVCFMSPFNGDCNMPEQQSVDDVVKAGSNGFCGGVADSNAQNVEAEQYGQYTDSGYPRAGCEYDRSPRNISSSREYHAHNNSREYRTPAGDCSIPEQQDTDDIAAVGHKRYYGAVAISDAAYDAEVEQYEQCMDSRYPRPRSEYDRSSRNSNNSRAYAPNNSRKYHAPKGRRELHAASYSREYNTSNGPRNLRAANNSREYHAPNGQRDYHDSREYCAPNSPTDDHASNNSREYRASNSPRDYHASNNSREYRAPNGHAPNSSLRRPVSRPHVPKAKQPSYYARVHSSEAKMLIWYLTVHGMISRVRGSNKSLSYTLKKKITYIYLFDVQTQEVGPLVKRHNETELVYTLTLFLNVLENHSVFGPFLF